jgi:protein-S-isoprenylcysteine O-methyltransferase Ste14
MSSVPLITEAAMRPYFQTHLVAWVWIAVACAALVVEASGALRRRVEASKRDRGSLIVLRVCTIPAGVLLVLSPRIAPALEIRPPLVSALAGVVIFTGGEALRVWSKVALGRYFTYTVQTSIDQPVITSGPYRALRHPSYTGILLMVLGVGAVWGNWLGLGVLVAVTALALSYRIHIEEDALLDDLGERYRVYARHHKRLIPFLW